MDKLYQNPKYVKMALTVLAFLLVMIFAPRMDGPRIINGVTFTTKTGSPGLTNFGLFLLVAVPVVTYLATGFLLQLISSGKDKDDDKERYQDNEGGGKKK